MNPDELRQAIIDHHLAGNPDAAAIAAQQLADHPDSEWTQMAQAAPSVTLREDPTPDAAPAEVSDAPATTARDDSDHGGVQGQNYLTGGLMDYTEAALQPFAKDVTLGIAPKVQNALAAAIYGPKGTFDSYDNFSKVYDAANEANEERQQQLANAHPYMNALGHVGGFIEGGRVLGDVLPGAPEGASMMGNIGRGAATGAGVGAVDSAVSGIGKEQSVGQRVTNALTSAALGGVVGGVAGPALGWAAEKLSPAARRLGIASGEIGTKMGDAWRKIAGKLDVEPDVLQAHLDQQRAQGITPTVAGVMQAKAAGQLNKVATANPEIATALNAGKTAAQLAGPDEMATAVERQIPPPQNPLLAGVASHEQAPATLQRALKTNMTTQMNAIRDRQVQLPDELLSDPDLNSAIQGRQFRALREKLDAVADPNNATSGHLNVGDIDDIRQQLMKVSPHPGSPHAQVAAELMNETRGQVPEYNDLMNNYAQAAQYNQGFNHGHTGQTAGAATNSSTVRALGGQAGQAGHQAGILINLRDKAAKGVDSAVDVATEAARTGATQRAIQAATPGGAPAIQDTASAIAARNAALARGTPQVQVPEEQNALGAVVRGTAAGAVGMTHTAGHHYGRAVLDFLQRNTFAPDVQREIGQGLMSTDRRVQAQTLDRLRQAGVDKQTLVNLGNKIAGMAGYAASDVINRGNAE